MFNPIAQVFLVMALFFGLCCAQGGPGPAFLITLIVFFNPLMYYLFIYQAVQLVYKDRQNKGQIIDLFIVVALNPITFLTVASTMALTILLPVAIVIIITLESIEKLH
jgi:hypothetical protein